MSAEGSVFSRAQMNQLMDLAEKGVSELAAASWPPAMTRRFTDQKLLFATHNAGKLEEMHELFAPFGVSVVGAAEMNLPEPEETEDTFVGNARIKAHARLQGDWLACAIR